MHNENNKMQFVYPSNGTRCLGHLLKSCLKYYNNNGLLHLYPVKKQSIKIRLDLIQLILYGKYGMDYTTLE